MKKQTQESEIERAFMIARTAHANQLYDIYPYEYHLRQTFEIAKENGLQFEIQIACILHDALEDTALSYNDIKKAFGEEIAEIVFCVTDELGRNRKERKMKTYPKIRRNQGAILVKLCDRIANVKHSKSYNRKLYEMYLNEHNEFIDNVVVMRTAEIDDLCQILLFLFEKIVK